MPTLRQDRAKYAAEDLAVLQSHERELVAKLHDMHHNVPGRSAVEAKYQEAKMKIERTKLARACIEAEKTLATYAAKFGSHDAYLVR